MKLDAAKKLSHLVPHAADTGTTSKDGRNRDVQLDLKQAYLSEHEGDEKTRKAMEMLAQHVEGSDQLQEAAAIADFLAKNLPTDSELKSTESSRKFGDADARKEVYALLAAKVAQLEKSIPSTADAAELLASRLPGVQKDRGTISKIATYGSHVLGLLEDNTVKHALPLLNSALFGKDIHPDKLHHDSTVDWLEKAGAAELAQRPADLVHRCIFVSTSGACSREIRDEMMRLVDESHAEDARLGAFMRFTTTPIMAPSDGRHIKNPDLHLVAHIHLCYDTFDVWNWLETNGLKIPEGGLNALVHGTTSELESSMPSLRRLTNPAHLDRHICETRASVNFEAAHEPKEVTVVDFERWLRGILAFLYVELLESMEKVRRFSCQQEVAAVVATLKKEGDRTGFRQIHREIVDDRYSSSVERRIALILCYMYGSKRACSSFEWLFPHGKALRDFVDDLSRLRDHISAQSARKHMQWAVSRLAHAAVTRLGRQAGVHATLHYTKKAVKTAVRTVTRVGSLLSQASFWLTALKPLVCLFGLAATFYGGFAGPETMTVLGTMGWYRAIAHVLLGDMAGQTLLRISDLYNVLGSMKDQTGVSQVIYIGFKVLDYVKIFLNSFLPGVSRMWTQVVAISDATQQAGVGQLLLGKVVGSDVMGDAAGAAYKAGALARAGAAALSIVALPLEAFGQLGVRVVRAAQYVAGGQDSPFYINVIVVLWQAYRGEWPLVLLKFMEYSCAVYHSGADSKRECKERVAGYRKLFNLMSSLSFAYQVFFGGLLNICVGNVAVLLREPLSKSFSTICIGHVTQISMDEMRAQSLKDLGYSQEEVDDMTLPDLTFKEFAGYEEGELNELLQKPHAAKASTLAATVKADYTSYLKHREVEKSFLKLFQNHNTRVSLTKYENSWQNLLHAHKDYSPEKGAATTLQHQLQNAKLLLKDAALHYTDELKDFHVNTQALERQLATHTATALTAHDFQKMKADFFSSLPHEERRLYERASRMGMHRVTGSEIIADLGTKVASTAGGLVTDAIKFWSDPLTNLNKEYKEAQEKNEPENLLAEEVRRGRRELAPKARAERMKTEAGRSGPHEKGKHATSHIPDEPRLISPYEVGQRLRDAARRKAATTTTTSQIVASAP